ncbi:MAG TPA: ferredoxin [Jatrophihabitantaceae bacterium]|jgi:ferredoxin|nr:ferredoxin [Jatrophihabitantaceae bacterium]
MRVQADVELCQGHAMCVLEDPTVFAFDSKVGDTVRILDPEPNDTHRESVARAVRFCPTMALSVHD